MNLPLVRSTYKTLVKRHGKRNAMSAVHALFSLPLTVREALTLKTWHIVWSTYSLYDPSYSNPEAFGFFVDVGNGWSTIIPSVAFSAGLIYGVPPEYTALWAVVCLCSFYQMLYGTVIYLLSYIYNKRYEGFGFFEVTAFVAVSNLLWIVFPTVGMGVCYGVVVTGSLEGVRGV